MTVYVDSENRIRAVGSTEDTSLKAVYIDENHPLYPFKGWSSSKICCYKVEVYGGVVTMMTPYVDSRNLEMADNIGHQIDSMTPFKETKTAYIDDTEVVFRDVPGGNLTVYVSDPEVNYRITRDNSYVTVEFTAPLEEVTEVTLTVQ